MTDEEWAAAKAAKEFRDEQGLGIAPIADIVALIEQTQDVDVTVLDVADGDEHGLSVADPVRGVTIVGVARSDKPMRWRSTLGHELGHLVFRDHDGGQPASLVFNAPVERRAQAFARHLLLPIEAIHQFLASREERGLAALSDLVQRFQVSPATAAIQLRAAGYGGHDGVERLASMYTPSLAARFGWMDQYRALQAESRQRRSPQRLLARAVAGYIAGVVTIETLAHIRGISPTDLTAELTEAGIEPDRQDGVSTRSVEEDVRDAGEFIDLSWMDDQ